MAAASRPPAKLSLAVAHEYDEVHECTPPTGGLCSGQVGGNRSPPGRSAMSYTPCGKAHELRHLQPSEQASMHVPKCERNKKYACNRITNKEEMHNLKLLRILKKN